MSTPEEILLEIETRLAACKEEMAMEVEYAHEQDELRKPFMGELVALCSLIRETETQPAYKSDHSIWYRFLAKAQRILDDAIDYACGETEAWPQMPSFGHSLESALVQDPFNRVGNALGSMLYDEMYTWA